MSEGGNRSAHWCFTVNNWTRDHERCLEELASETQYIVWGYEEGESGTPHLQGFVIFKRRKTFSAAKDALPPGTHLEPRRGTPYQAATYCKKDGLFKEFGSPPSPSRRSPFDVFCEWAMQIYTRHQRGPTEREIAAEFPALFVRYGRRLQQLAVHINPHPRLEEGVLFPWQDELLSILNTEPDDRTILFYVDPNGGKGKSWFQRWYMTSYPERTQILSIGKRDDIAHAIEEDKDVFFFNVPRGSMDHLQYTILEQLKDRVVFSPKYDSRMKVLSKRPHVVVFCNEAPDPTRMSADRYFNHYLD